MILKSGRGSLGDFLGAYAPSVVVLRSGIVDLKTPNHVKTRSNESNEIEMKIHS